MANETEQKYVIFDTDMGCDDAFALQMILKAEKYHKNVKLLAITAVNGNTTTDNVIKNSYRILDGLDRTDIPIYRGATEPLIPKESRDGFFHGANGFSDVDFWLPHYPKDANAIAQPKHAIEIIRDLVLEYPNKVTLMCVGPLTNIALAIKTFPEIKKAIKDVYIMGGNVKGVGNTTSCAEFNFHMDTESAYIVLESLSCPKTIVPWECCIHESCFISLEWRFEAFENIPCRNIQLLNQVDKIAYQNSDKFMPCDAFLTAAFLFPKCINHQESHHATVELHGHLTRGMMVLDHIRKKEHNVNIVQTIYLKEFKEILLWTGAGDGQLEL